jgi:nitroreductase
MLREPGPDEKTLRSILAIAARAPDHRRVTPFRFILFQDDARGRFGDALADAFQADNPGESSERIEKERNRFLRAPVVVAVVSSVDPEHRTPEWEQLLTAGAVCQNMLLAASAHGYAAQWITEWYAYDDRILQALDLGRHEKVAGYIYIGSAKEDPKERARPDLDAVISHF